MSTPEKTLGQIAYEAYRAKQLAPGEVVPPYSSTSPSFREQWEAAAQAVAEAVRQQG